MFVLAQSIQFYISIRLKETFFQKKTIGLLKVCKGSFIPASPISLKLLTILSMTNAWQHSQQTSEPHPLISEVCGQSWWKAMEGVVESINCDDCRTHGQQLLSGMRDLINLQIGKPVHNLENFRNVVSMYYQALMTNAYYLAQSLPRCTPAQARKVEDCIQEVKGRGDNVNPWAACSVSIGCSPGARTEIEEMDLDGTPVIVVTDDDDDMIDAVEDLLIKEGAI